MAQLLTGDKVSLYITTENTEASSGSVAVLSGSATLTSASGANVFIKCLGTTIPDSATRILDVTLCELDPEKEYQDVEYLGRKSRSSIKIREKGTVTITRQRSNNKWATIFDEVENGVTGSAPPGANDSTNPRTTDSGFRIYACMNGTSSAGENTDWYTFTNCLLKYKPILSAGKVQEEQLIFEGFNTVHDNDPYTTSAADSDL